MTDSLVERLEKCADAHDPVYSEDSIDEMIALLREAAARLREVEGGEAVFHLRSYGDVSAADLDRITSRTPTDAALRGLVERWRAEAASLNPDEAADRLAIALMTACADELEALVGKAGG